MRKISLSFLLIGFVINPAIDGQASNTALPDICENNEFTACLNITKTKCLFAYVQSTKNCSEKYSIDSAIEKENEALREIAEKYGNCVISDFIELMGVQISQFERCSVHLKPVFSKHEEKARKELERLDDEFFNTD